MFDIAFISYNEPNADQNWQLLKTRFPISRRTHGVNGIHQAHIAAAKLCYTKMFWVVDGDSTVVEDFNFQNPKGCWEESVYVYKSRNPINGLTYGYGGIKLLNRQHTLDMDINSVDMTTNISEHFTAVDQVANITNFNTDPFNTWKSAFRECVKLSAKVIDRQIDTETEERLETWCTVGADRPYGEYALAGAQSGKEYGLKFGKNPDLIKMINNFKWLEDYFKQQYGS